MGLPLESKAARRAWQTAFNVLANFLKQTPPLGCMPAPMDYFEQSLFAEHDFRFQMRFRKAALRDFYMPSAESPEILAERRKWLATMPEKTALLLPDGEALLRRVATEFLNDVPKMNVAGFDLLRMTSAALEPDFLLLKPANGETDSKIAGGAICFPSSWAFEEKLGQTMEFTHGPVPGLNATLGGQISRFLQKIPPGLSWERTNWGLSRSPELNQHPSRHLPRLDETASAEEVFLRIEWQSLASFPPEGVLFGIRVYVFPFRDVLEKAAWRSGLKRDLESMPEALLRYKGLWKAKSKLLELLA
jgi:hypothetical protein